MKTYKVTLAPRVAARLEEMATQRETPVGELLADLVVIGMKGLDYPPLEPITLLKGHDPSGDSCEVTRRR